jgi:two-component system, OmpR family, response regulator
MAECEVRILLVDDEIQVRRYFRQLLQGFCLVDASTAREANRLLDESVFSIVVLDLSMPAADGFEVLHHIRTDHPNVAVLVVSGVMPENTLEMAKHLGAALVLDKIAAPTRLRASVEALVEASKTGHWSSGPPEDGWGLE